MIGLKRGADFPTMHQAAVLQDYALVADIPQHPGAMARQHHDLASSDAILHALLGTGHELQVACTHPLVQQSDVVLHGCGNRSEEHTSELQSLMSISYAVFCLKKKRQKDTSVAVRQDANKCNSHPHKNNQSSSVTTSKAHKINNY